MQLVPTLPGFLVPYVEEVGELLGPWEWEKTAVRYR